MSLVWMIPVFGVSVLTVIVVSKLLDAQAGCSARRLIASAVGVLMLVEGASVLLASSGFPQDAGMTATAHGVAMIMAGAGVWSMAHRSLWSSVSTNRH